MVDVYDFGNDQHIAFLIMEYVEGDPLSATLSRVGRLTPARTMALVAQAADALHAAHVKGIVHRDVKPGNLLVRPNGTLVLTDFGIARSELVGQLTAAGSVLGTASYISPEQATGQVATPASDVYALGVVAYQCLAGRRPFEGDNPLDIAMRHVRETPRPLPSDIPPQVCALVERAMAKDPKDRWPSAAVLAGAARQLKAALSRQARGGAGQAAPISAAPASPAPGRAQVPPRAAPHAPQVSPAAPVAPAPAGDGTAVEPPAGGAAGEPPAGGATAAPDGGRSGGSRLSTRRGHGPAGLLPAAHFVTDAPRRSRPGMVFLAIVLGVLVVVCSGVISYKLRNSLVMPGGASVPAVTSEALRPDGRDDPAGTAYRRLDQPRPDGLETPTSEGR